VFETGRKMLGIDDPVVIGNEMPLALFDTNCTNTPCSNSIYTIRVTAMSGNPHVLCGACGQRVTSFAPVTGGSRSAVLGSL
jgi:hypothetical protein